MHAVGIMSRPNAARALPDEPDDALPLAAPAPLFTSGVELLVRQLGAALNDGQEAFAALMHAEASGDRAALHAAALRLATALAVDPKALANRIEKQVKP
jgi:hypothetical protein